MINFIMLITTFLIIAILNLVLCHPGPQPEVKKIVDGTAALAGSFPYMAALESNGVQICGGSVIRNDVILTAAHCFIDDDGPFKIRSGTLNRQSGGQLVDVKKKITHPRFSEFAGRYDVALVQLKEPLDMKAYNIKTVKLVKENVTTPDGSPVIVTGWGLTEDDGLPSDVLLFTEVRIVGFNKCSEMYSSLVKLAETMMCAGSVDGKGHCNQDSGGPLIYKGKQIGIVSLSKGCADPDFPGVYTNVSFVKSWIDKELAKLSE